METSTTSIFVPILKGLLLPNNEDRMKAEEAYNSIPLNEKVFYLLSVLQDSSFDIAERQMACVLIRRLFTNHFSDFFPKLTVEEQNRLKECLLTQLENEWNEQVKRKLCDVVSELARNLMDDEGNNLWPAFLGFLFQSANAESPLLKETALRMFTNVPGIFGNVQNQYIDLIKRMLHQSLTDLANVNVRMQAVRAVCSFIILHEKETDIQKEFQDLLLYIIRVMEETVDINGGDSGDCLLKWLIDLCESAPRFIRPQLSSVIQLCLKVFSNNDAEDAIRHLALEVMVTLCEVSGPAMRKESPNFIGPLIEQILIMMAELDDDDDQWSTLDEPVDEDNESNSITAESAIDRIACGLGGKIVLPCVTRIIPSMLSSSDWKQRHAALMAMSAIGEGCHKCMSLLLNDIMNAGVIPFLHDQHPRVRYAACNAVGQISSDFAPIPQKQFHQKIVPALLLLLDDHMNPRVQAHAGAAFVNFSEDCPKYILLKYLDAIMIKLGEVLSIKFKELVENGTKLVLEQIVTTIASVADTAEEQFVAFYDKLIPYLKCILNDARTSDMKLLRGKTLECISLIGLAVGPDKFRCDAKEVMDILLKVDTIAANESDQLQQQDTDDPYNTYLISAWARICIVLGKEFQPYLPLVIDRVMKTAAMKPEVALLDNESLEQMDDYNSSSWQFVSVGEQQNFGIRTSGLEDKVAACEMLVCYARELKEAFADYAEQVVRLMVSLLKFYFHDGVRTAAAQSLPHLIESVKCKGVDYVKDMWHFVCPELLAAISCDTEIEVIGDMYASLGQCIELLGNGCLTDEWMNTLLALIDKSITQHFTSSGGSQVISVNNQDDDHDQHHDGEEIGGAVCSCGTATCILSRISDVIHSLFCTYGQDFFPHFDKLLPHYLKMLQDSNERWYNHQWAVCVFDDMIEYTGPACVRYQHCFLPALLDYTNHAKPDVRQACYYGIGVLAMHAGPSFANTCAEAVPKLIAVIQSADSKSEENCLATENALSALTKILKYNNQQLNVDEILPHWLGGLPVVEDEEEIPHVYGYLCDLIEANDAAILGGPANANVPVIVSAILEVFSKDAMKKEHPVAQRMIRIVHQIQNSPELFEACLARQSKEGQIVLYDLLNFSHSTGKLL